MLSVDELLAVKHLVKEIALPDRGGTVCVRALLAIEQLRLDVLLKAAKDDAEQQIALQCAAYLCAPDGTLILSADQAKRLVSSLTARDLAVILRAGTDMSRVDDKGIEDASKN